MAPSAAFLARLQQLQQIVPSARASAAYDEFVTRYSEIVRDCVALNSARLSLAQRARLLQLASDMENDAAIPRPSQLAQASASGPTSAEWEALLESRGNCTWQHAPAFFAGQYLWHVVLLLTEYFTSGIDPFRPWKTAELAQEAPWKLLQTAVGLSKQPPTTPSRHEQLRRLCKICLWGNKLDGGYKVVKNSISGADASLEQAEELLLVDDSGKVACFLERKARGAKAPGGAQSLHVQFINDNCSTELLLDLALADHLLVHGWCGRVTLNVKAEPMYVSDATEADVHEHITAMQDTSRSSEVQALGRRLAKYVEQQQLIVRPDIFWNRYAYYWEMPLELQQRLGSEATLVVLKGDLNYRRLLGDRLWPPSTPVEEAVPYFPAPFVSLRTLKADPVVGIPAPLVAKLEDEDARWRFNGTRGTIQSVLTPASET